MSAKGNNPFALNKTNSFVITEEPLFLFYEINVGIIFQRLGTTAFKLYGSLKDISLLILFGSLWTHSDLKLIFLICRKSYDSNFTILISLVISVINYYRISRGGHVSGLNSKDMKLLAILL